MSPDLCEEFECPLQVCRRSGGGGYPFLTRRADYMAGVVGWVPGKGSYVAGKAV